MTCFLFTWHTVRLSPPPHTALPSKFISPGGRSCTCNKSCYHDCQKPPPGWKNCNVINTENLCLQKYNFSYFFLGCQKNFMPMICLLCTYCWLQPATKVSRAFWLVFYSAMMARKSWEITQCTKRETSFWKADGNHFAFNLCSGTKSLKTECSEQRFDY